MGSAVEFPAALCDASCHVAAHVEDAHDRQAVHDLGPVDTSIQIPSGREDRYQSGVTLLQRNGVRRHHSFDDRATGEGGPRHVVNLHDVDAELGRNETKPNHLEVKLGGLTVDVREQVDFTAEQPRRPDDLLERRLSS